MNAKQVQDRFTRPREELKQAAMLIQQDVFLRVRGELTVEIWQNDHVPVTEHGRNLLRRDGRCQMAVHQPNLVVTVARKMLSRLMTGCIVKSGESCLIEDIGGNDYDVRDIPEHLYVERMMFGSGGHNASSSPPGLAIPPTPADIDLAGTGGAIEITTGVFHKVPEITYPGPLQVQFYATLEGNEANGSGVQPISEEVLVNSQAASAVFVFARTTFNQLLKSSSVSFSFQHRILY